MINFQMKKKIINKNKDPNTVPEEAVPWIEDFNNTKDTAASLP